MNSDFHYYTTFILCRSAGFSRKDSWVMAFSDQYTDDNNRVCRILLPGGRFFKNSISCVRNPFDIGPASYALVPFHFLPGDINYPKAARRDGKKSPLNVTPAGLHATRLLDRALDSGDLFRSGLMLHVFQDSFSHQNFTGLWDDWNDVCGNKFIPNIGHAEAGDIPDMFNTFWIDKRLSIPRRIDNNERFFDCMRTLLHILCMKKKQKYTAKWRALRPLLESAITSTAAEDEKTRCENLRELYKETFAETMPEYRLEDWLSECTVRKSMKIFAKENFLSSRWYRFQKAVKKQKFEILCYFFQKDLFDNKL